MKTYEVIFDHRIVLMTESKRLAIYKAKLWGNSFVWEVYDNPRDIYWTKLVFSS